MEISMSRIIISSINFIILYFILKHYLFNPVNSVIESRQNSINEKISKAEKDLVEAENLKIERDNSLKSLEEEGRKIIEDCKFKAEKVSEEIVKEAKEEARITMNRVKNEIQREQEKAREELKSELVGLAFVFAEKALATSLDENMQRKLINDFIAKVDH